MAENRTYLGATGVCDRRIETLHIAKGLLAQSLVRQKLFDGFLGQPSWEMLLCLYIADQEGAVIAQSVLCASSGRSSAVARMWLRRMEHNGLIARRSRTGFPNQTMVEITAEAAGAMECLLQDLAAGLHLSTGDCASVT